MKQPQNLWRPIALALLLGVSLVLMSVVRLTEQKQQPFLVDQPELAACNTCTPHSYNRGCFNPHKIKRVVSYAIYKMPDSPEPRAIDIAGMLHNLRLMRIIYPGWRMHISISDSINQSTSGIEFLKQQPDVTLEWFAFDPTLPTLGAVKRFMVAADPTVDAFIVRDLDSRLSLRERYAVDDWLDSDRKLMAMRDHPQHGIYVLAGMWGGRTNAIVDIDKRMDKFKESKETFDRYGADQHFLATLRDVFEDHTYWIDSFNHSTFTVTQANYTKDFPKPGRRLGDDSRMFVGSVNSPAHSLDCNWEEEICWQRVMSEKDVMQWLTDNPVLWCKDTCTCK